MSPSPPPPHPPPSPSNTSDDSSIIELSFEYDINPDGKLIRVSKASSNSPYSSPPTPPENHVSKPSAAASPPSSSSLIPPTARRSSLSRSESMPSDAQAPVRPLQRVVSGPLPIAVTPGQPARGIMPLSTGLRGTGRKLGGAQRVTREEAREIEERIRREEEAERERARRETDEKENNAQHSPPPPHVRPIAGLPTRQTLQGFPRIGRPVIGQKHTSGFSKISEAETSEGERDELEPSANGQSIAQQRQVQNNGLRRSFSEGSPDTLAPEAQGLSAIAHPTTRAQPRYVPLSLSRTNTAPIRARRVTHEERLRQDQDIAEEEALERVQETEENPEAERQGLSGSDASPTHVLSRLQQQQSHNRPTYTHQRRESDTLRSAPPPPQAEYDIEPQPLPPRLSPSARQYVQVPPPPQRHRRSPTAPDVPASGTLVPGGNGRDGVGNTWGAGEDEGYEHEQGRKDSGERHARPSSTQVSQQQRQSRQVQPAPSVPDVRTRNLVVNKKPYARLDMIGKGGSSRVYRVMNSANEIYAIKRVALDKTDTETLGGYMNEIALLKRLGGGDRIIRLIDSEVKAGTGGSKGHLMLVMECGEIDLARLLQERQQKAMDMIWIVSIWHQILQAVHVIHEEKIVHSDLKPANFVLVKGQLKLIDFGIAKAIANDTTNIQRDHQIGTVNYMSPEAIELPDGMRRLKVGRSSDVWSLGCILYQMVYGYPPFQHLSVYQKMKAIPDVDHAIEFPEYSVPSVPTPRNVQGTPTTPTVRLDHLSLPVRADVIKSMQKCLQRNPKYRSTIPELLDEEWLALNEPPKLKQGESVIKELPKLKQDESIINPYYMRQLIEYVTRCALEGNAAKTEAEKIEQAERLVQELKSIVNPES